MRFGANDEWPGWTATRVNLMLKTGLPMDYFDNMAPEEYAEMFGVMDGIHKAETLNRD